MEPAIVSNHAALSKCAVHFLHYSIQKGKCLDRLELLDDSLPRFLRNYPYPLHSWPWFIGSRMQQTLKNCVLRVPEFVYRAVRREFEKDIPSFMAFYGVPDVLAMIFLDNGMKLSQLMLRIDAILTADGLKVLEINAGPSIGGWQIHWMDRLYRNNESLSPFFADVECSTRNIPLAYIEHIVAQGAQCAKDKDGSVNVVFIVRESDVSDGIGDAIQGIFQDALAANGLKGELSFQTGFDALTYMPHGIFIGIKRVSSLVSLSFNTASLGERFVPPLDLYRAFLRGQVFWPDNPFFSVIGDKRSLAVLRKHMRTDLFSDAERQLIDVFVPWSAIPGPLLTTFRGQTAPLAEVLRDHRESIVVKAARGAQGEDVFIGRLHSMEAWEAIISRVMSEGEWLAQEYCASLPFYGQSGGRGYTIHDVVWGVFGFGECYGGCWLRLMPKEGGGGIINSAKGAQEAIVYEVKE
ncbi:hypothetical protein [Rhodanobacter sp. MP1X3]|uniref:hypothetical protein n=1 Tax=Rhodanobacter sp. MP1X3 TaxID=2723086 RepID=UPI001621EF6E|nr:hypothetical protein [Rhodanobacter sp. MP1X3]MBB6244691.1 hypothetical protein [Rhodanobacter sp. MP1X3]